MLVASIKIEEQVWTQVEPLPEVQIPSGRLAYLYSSIESRQHDSAMLALSGLMDLFNQFSYDQYVLSVYGYLACPLQASFGEASTRKSQ